MIRTPIVQTMLDDTTVTHGGYNDLGTPINVNGYGDVTIYFNSAGTTTNDLTCKIYVLDSGAQPADTTTMHWVSTTVVDVSVDDLVATSVNCAAKWIWVNGEHASAGAKVTIKVVGTAANL